MSNEDETELFVQMLLVHGMPPEYRGGHSYYDSLDWWQVVVRAWLFKTGTSGNWMDRTNTIGRFRRWCLNWRNAHE